METITIRFDGLSYIYEGVGESGGTFTYGERGTAGAARKAAKDARTMRGIQTGKLPRIVDEIEAEDEDEVRPREANAAFDL